MGNVMGSKDRGGSYPSTSSTVVRLYTSSQSMLFQTHPRRSCTVHDGKRSGIALRPYRKRQEIAE